MDDRLVTQAVDPSKFDKDKLDLDSQRLNLKVQKLEGDKYAVSDKPNVKTKDAVSEGLSLKNPFVGK